MINLECDVESCAHNKAKSCDQHEIRVEGRNAHTSGETKCSSFECKKGGCNC